ncbi:MAG: preprotein translocase subunit SecG [Candidatus Levybacteria bacterium]|nr:preprotein translocase subunit SecG [Candidatus Levybacteria bacterium]
MIVILFLQIVISILLIGAVLLQNQSGGLSSAFGGGGEFYRSRRSLEKILFVGTIALSAAFGILSVILLMPR